MIDPQGDLPNNARFPAYARFDEKVCVFGPVAHYLGPLDVSHARCLRGYMMKEAFKWNRLGSYPAERGHYALVFSNPCTAVVEGGGVWHVLKT